MPLIGFRRRGWNLHIINAERTRQKFLRMTEKFEALPLQGTMPIAREMMDYASSISHRWSGMLAASHRIRYYQDGRKKWRGEIYIDPTRINPWTGIPVTFYAPIEHARGESHAFYQRTYDRYRRRAGAQYVTFAKEYAIERGDR